MYPNFPTLTKDQIECKVKQITSKGVVVLLYKTARVDMDMLDSVVGPMNWQDQYRNIDGVLYCSIAIRDPNTNEWVPKEDCGIESRADGEGNEKKGEASDAFKRAGFRWNIGRELYSSPFIFIPAPVEKDDRGKWSMKNKFEKFSVSHIAYDDDRKISELIITSSDGDEVFKYPRFASGKSSARKSAPKSSAKPTSENPAPVITGSIEDHSAPWESNPDEVTQDMVTGIINDYVKDKDVAAKRKLTAAIKQINKGSGNYKDISNPEIRKELYNYFWNLNNAIA